MSSAIEAQANLKTWKAVEEWRVDGAPGEPFADLRDYVVTKDGALWVLDFKDQNIRRYDANGRPLATISRKGSGPGEMRNANGVAIGPDGLVWANDPGNGRLTVFGLDGKYVRQITSGARGYGYRWMATTNKAKKELVEQSFATTTSEWKRYDSSGNALGTLPFSGCSGGKPTYAGFRAETKGKGSSNGAYPFTNGGGLVPDDAGNVWCASANATRVALVRMGAHDTIAQTTVVIPILTVSNEERNDQIAKIEKRISTYETNDFDKSKIPGTKSGIGALHVDDDGRLWVQHTGVFKTKSATFDVFDSNGKHLGRVTIPVAHREYLPLRARGDFFWITVTDDDDAPSVVKYKIQK
ncbi:MAG: hypothetical protein ABJB66_10000 [Gemmatimonadaceae bacterium]